RDQAPALSPLPDTAPRRPHSLQSNRCSRAIARPSATPASSPAPDRAPSTSAQLPQRPSSQFAPAAPCSACELLPATSLPPQRRRNQLFLNPSFFIGRIGFLLRAQRELILRLPRDALLLSVYLRRVRHVQAAITIEQRHHQRIFHFAARG